MLNQKEDLQKGNKKIIPWLAHHNPERTDFDEHVFYIFNYAICIGCFAFVLGATIGLILSNILYYYILDFISLPLIFMIFFFWWIPSILQYSIQIVRKESFRNRIIKFLIRLLYPIGSSIFIFKSPILGFSISVPVGYLIVYIRKIKNKTLALKKDLRQANVKKYLRNE
ncbi:MAG: hypothetical protein ACFFG0_12935 [Candidatus Thorarchaeota archaeon]